MFARELAKVTLKNRGWSYRRAAPRLGVSYQHLSDVLNGKRHSDRLLRAINKLPPAQR
jgi:transcriptional regulator with XRE-family HTH domain